MITQLLIEPTENAVAFLLTSWGLTDDGSPVTSVLNIKTDKQNIIDLLASPDVVGFTPLRIRIYFDDLGNVSTFDIYDKAIGSTVFTGAVLNPDTASQAVTLRQFIEAKPVVKTSVDPATLKDVPDK